MAVDEVDRESVWRPVFADIPPAALSSVDNRTTTVAGRSGSAREYVMADVCARPPLSAIEDSTERVECGDLSDAVALGAVDEDMGVHPGNCACSEDISLQIALHHLRGAVRATIALFRPAHSDSSAQRRCELLQHIIQFEEGLG